MSKKSETPLSGAASRIEEELTRFEQLLHELSRPVSTDKALQRARAALEECSSCEERLAATLTAFAQAIQGIQTRQQNCMEILNERVGQIQARHADRSALVERLALLGVRTGEISKPIVALGETAWHTVTPELLASVSEVSTRLEGAIGEAAEICASARASDWSDLARDADALKQQLQAVRNQVVLGQRKLSSQAPS